MSFRSIQSLPNQFLVLYWRQIEQQKQCLQMVRRALPPSLAQHALHCVIDGGKLILYTDSAAWASQLRFHKTAILASLSARSGPPVGALQIRILTERAGLSETNELKANIPSAENIEMIRQQSDYFPDNELKQALQRLCATLSRR